MPPAISDDEMSDPGVANDVVPKKLRKSAKEETEDDFDDDGDEVVDTKDTNGIGAHDHDEDGDGDGDGDEDEDNEEDLDEDEYVVEKIFAHYIANDGLPRFEVKWEGYPKKSDRTWEEEDNLKENAAEVLKEYFNRIGGREKMFEDTKAALTARKRGRQSASATPTETKRSKKSNGTHPLDTTPPASAKAAEWKPPSGSWEDHVEQVDMCQDEETGTFIVYLTWKNGKKTQHPKEVVYRRCPQKMLRFYERHIRISRDGGEPVPIGSMTQ